jgi:hypothetical protein
VSADDRLLGQLAAVARQQQAQDPPAELMAADPARQEALVDVVLGKSSGDRPPLAGQLLAPMRRRLGRWIAGLVLPLAAAAGIALWWRMSPPPLPPYTATVTGGVSEVRGPEDPGAPLVIEGDAPVQVILRPERATTVTVGAAAFWVRGDEVRAWSDAHPERSAAGAFLLRGRAERPFGPGPGFLLLVVAPAGEVPRALDAARLRAPSPGWRVVRHPVVWR